MNWSLSVCLFQSEFYSSNYVILNDTDVSFTLVFVVSLCQYDIPICYFLCFWLFFILCLSLRERRYSFFHLFQAASLQRLIYRCCSLITSSSSSNCSSGIVIGCPCTRMFGVITRNWISSSTYISGGLFKFIFVPSMTSSSSCFVSFDSPAVLYKHCFTNRHPWPPHYGALLRLNFLFTCSVTKNSCILSSLWTFFTHFETFSNALTLSEYITSGLPILAISRFSACINSCVVWFVNFSRCTALVRLQPLHGYR